MTMRGSVGAAALATAVLCGLAVGPAGVGLPAPPVATAHSVLLAVDPSDGSTVQTPPEEVTLTFNEPVNPEFTTLTVMDASRTDHARGGNTVDGEKVSARVDDLPAGDYTIGYRVTSADGHVIQGSSRFTVAGGPGGAGTGVDSTAPTTRPTADDGDSAGSTTALVVLGGLAVLLIVGALVLLRRGRN